MSRLRADFLLLLAALIWGAAFLAQKTAMDNIGPYFFTGLRFSLSVLVILPFLYKERRSQAAPEKLFATWPWLLAIGVAFSGGVLVQQIGIIGTTITNAGFLTSLYVLFTPIVSLLLFKIRPNPIVWLAAPLCVLGVWMLGSGALAPLHASDFLVIAAAFFFALHIVLVGYVLSQGVPPFMMVVTQYAICALASFAFGAAFETLDMAAITGALPQILYAGVISGGIAYTLQIIAQQYTPASDAAIILSSEALFAAFAGMLFLGDRLYLMGWAGCAVIMVGILLVELYPLLRRGRKVKPQ